MPAAFAAARGLSPPTRGNHSRKVIDIAAEGSIPAHAGEPAAAMSCARVVRVYPRPRGGTSLADSALANARGLSPPTRGNPLRRPADERQRRSIPAHAGEPCSTPRAPRGGSVYPRPRGGTLALRGAVSPAQGLSPPTRGNPELGAYRGRHAGSIPAHAGEPASGWRRPRLDEVYPRPRGGTRSAMPLFSRLRGLSPPTRGNRADIADGVLTIRSIPAHAGEPDAPIHVHARRGVYPRPRGGTFMEPRRARRTPGLSPPTRGNHILLVVPQLWRRSIPAHAGEPPVHTAQPVAS